jgi:hypothetical protein
MYSSYLFFTSALEGVSGQRHALAALYRRERTPGTHCTGGLVGLGASKDTEGIQDESFACAGNRNPDVQSVVSTD